MLTHDDAIADGYIPGKEAAEILGIVQGGDLYEKLAKMGVRHLIIPAKNGDRGFHYFKRDDVQGVKESFGGRKNKQTNGEFEAAVISQLEEIRRELSEIKGILT